MQTRYGSRPKAHSFWESAQEPWLVTSSKPDFRAADLTLVPSVLIGTITLRNVFADYSTFRTKATAARPNVRFHGLTIGSGTNFAFIRTRNHYSCDRAVLRLSWVLFAVVYLKDLIHLSHIFDIFFFSFPLFSRHNSFHCSTHFFTAISSIFHEI